MEVSKSGFYEHLGRRRSNARIEREALEGLAVEASERRKGRYGYRRIDVYCQALADKIGVMISTLSAFCVPTAFPTSEICQA